ncbi:hypothetical protein P3W45_001676 [Vairimorpha bombi]|jgi:hydroxyacylglutathione hydrolase
MNFISIRVSDDNNLMYLFYTSEIAFSVDSTDPHLLIESLDKSFTREYYLPHEIRNLPVLETTRKLIYSFTTHHHFDHSSGDNLLRDLIPDIIQIKGEGSDKKYDVSGIPVQAISTPCHTRDSTCYLVDNKYLCTGDTIFYLGCGRFFEGDAKDMLESIRKIKKLNNNLILLYGHDYRESNRAFIKYISKEEIPKDERIWLTLGEEKKFNPFFLVETEEEMRDLRERKNNFRI